MSKVKTPHLLPDFTKSGGLVPAIAQDYKSGEVLMLAWMNIEAWRATLNQGMAIYWSRSRGLLWKKGEKSGKIVKDIILDCDKDSVLLKVKQIDNVACHTGRSRFFAT